jgi:hypothetical protein
MQSKLVCLLIQFEEVPCSRQLGPARATSDLSFAVSGAVALASGLAGVGLDKRLAHHYVCNYVLTI